MENIDFAMNSFYGLMIYNLKMDIKVKMIYGMIIKVTNF